MLSPSSSATRIGVVPAAKPVKPSAALQIAALSEGLVVFDSHDVAAVLGYGSKVNVQVPTPNQLARARRCNERASDIEGLVGLLPLRTTTYLLIMTRSREVTKLFDDTKQIHSVEDVAAIPITYYGAIQALTKIVADQGRSKVAHRDQSSNYYPDPVTPLTETPPTLTSHLESTDNTSPSRHPSDPSDVHDHGQIIADAIQLCKGLLFSRTFDITRSFQSKALRRDPSNPNSDPLLSHFSDGGNGPDELHSTWALWRRADPFYWFNAHMMQAFIALNLHALILPLMQGYCQTTKLRTKDSTREMLLAVISRRSCKRSGMRYQSRGIDDAGNVSNFVETEQILRAWCNDTWQIFSYVQIRGSIPLYWSQSPYSIKPEPVLNKSPENSKVVTTKHMTSLVEKYGPSVHCINLAELNGREETLSSAWGRAVQIERNPSLRYMNWDFHRICKGMRFERVSLLVSSLEESFNAQSFYWQNGPDVLSTQSGVFRVNCVDCLDRSNVVMSALARQVVDNQLACIGLAEVFHNRNEAERRHNDIWANNGDAISTQYAGTSALKGGFVRTGQRNLKGVYDDAWNSLTRLYRGVGSDHFRQCTLDLVLGVQGVECFDRLLQGGVDHMASASADNDSTCELASEMVVVTELDGEVRGSWVMLSPLDSKQPASGLIDKILILASKSIIIVNWQSDINKVSQFTRVALSNIERIKSGTYYTLPIEGSNEDNCGVAIQFSASRSDTRKSTYASDNFELDSRASQRELVLLKAATNLRSGTAREQINSIIKCLSGILVGRAASTRERFLEEDICSLSQANSVMSLLERMKLDLRSVLYR